MSLILINGGGPEKKRKANDKALRKQARRLLRLRQLDLDADHMFFVLPAPTRAEIAKRLSLRLRRTVDIYYVDLLLAHVRDHAQRLGWTAIFAPPGPNPALLDRYQPALVNANGTLFTDVEVKSVEDGLYATATVIVTKTRRFAAMARAAAKHHPNAARARELVNFAYDLDYFNRKTATFRDDVLAKVP